MYAKNRPICVLKIEEYVLWNTIIHFLDLKLRHLSCSLHRLLYMHLQNCSCTDLGHNLLSNKATLIYQHTNNFVWLDISPFPFLYFFLPFFFSFFLPLFPPSLYNFLVIVGPGGIVFILY